MATKDYLSELAAQQGISLSKYLTDYAKSQRRAAIIAAAREEALLDESNPLAAGEYELWEGTLEDGID